MIKSDKMPHLALERLDGALPKNWPSQKYSFLALGALPKNWPSQKYSFLALYTPKLLGSVISKIKFIVCKICFQ